jgi:hypothetical protein
MSTRRRLPIGPLALAMRHRRGMVGPGGQGGAHQCHCGEALGADHESVLQDWCAGRRDWPPAR